MTWSLRNGLQSLEFWCRIGAEVSLADFRKTSPSKYINEAGQLAIAYKIYRCWVSEYQASPDLDANQNAIANTEYKA